MSHLNELARQVRGTTVRILEEAPDDWFLWVPPGTSNHITWHAGHSLWAQEVLCVEPLSGSSELSPAWGEKFGMNSKPAETVDWPDRAELLQLLTTQLDRMIGLFDEHASRLAQIGPNRDDAWDLPRGVIHALHDEARHQGEMRLLVKLRRHLIGTKGNS